MPSLETQVGASDASTLLQPVVRDWLDTIKVAERFKQEFDDDARQCMKYLKGPYDFIWQGSVRKGGGFTEGDLDDIPAPTHRLTINKAFEYNAIYGPLLYNRNPAFRVTSRRPVSITPESIGIPMDPQVQMAAMQIKMQDSFRHSVATTRADLLQSYLNYLPNENGLKETSRQVVDDALIKGMGIWWHELWQPVGSTIKMPISTRVSPFDIVFDPDFESVGNASWIARKRTMPIWQVLQLFPQVDPRDLRPNIESARAQGANRGKRGSKHQKNFGRTNDLMEFYEVYSKMGAGDRLKESKVSRTIKEDLQTLGDYVYLVVADGVPYPLNMNPKAIPAIGIEGVQEATSWPVPAFLDEKWPFSRLSFHHIPDELYPTPPLKPALGEMKFVSWCMSYIASKIRTSSRDFIAVLKGASSDIKERILHGGDYSLLEIERAHGGTIKNVVDFLQHPQFNGDIWMVLQAMQGELDRRIGMPPAMAGMPKPAEPRSAYAAASDQRNLSARPDDMAQRVEDAMTDVGRHWAIISRWYIDGQDVAPVLGPVGAHFWEQLVMSADITEVTRELNLRVESGSLQKPNFERDVAQMDQAMNVMFSLDMQHAQMTGDYQPLNALITDWGKARQIDIEKYLFAPQPPMPLVEAQLQSQASAEQGEREVQKEKAKSGAKK